MSLLSWLSRKRSSGKAPPESETIGRLLTGYKASNPDESAAAFEELRKLAENKDQRLIPPLLQDLTNPQGEVRSLAGALLGSLGDKRAVEPLIKLLEDPVWDARYSAIESLGKLGGRDAILPIIKCVSKERNFRVRGKGLHVLEHVFRTVDPRIIGHIQASWEANGIDLNDQTAGF
jgi:HEAT repeat protein